MKIYDLYLDDYDRQEYLCLLRCLCDYYYILFGSSVDFDEIR